MTGPCGLDEDDELLFEMDVDLCSSNDIDFEVSYNKVNQKLHEKMPCESHKV